AAEIEDIRSIGVEWSPQRNFCFAINVAVIRKILLVNRGIIFAICRISQFGRLLSDEVRQRRLIQVVVRQLKSAVGENMGAFVGDIRNLQIGVTVELLLHGYVPGVYGRESKPVWQRIELRLLSNRSIGTGAIRIHAGSVVAINVLHGEGSRGRENKSRNTEARSDATTVRTR